MDKAKRLIEEILADLTSRSGLGNEWDNIDEVLQQEIICAWEQIAERYTS